MPNYVKVDSKPFHPDSYIGPEHDDDEGLHDVGRETSMTIKLKVENTLRWRWAKDALGQDVGYPPLRVPPATDPQPRLKSRTVASSAGLTAH